MFLKSIARKWQDQFIYLLKIYLIVFQFCYTILFVSRYEIYVVELQGHYGPDHFCL